MKHDTYFTLEELWGIYRQNTAKIIQCLLGLSFYEVLKSLNPHLSIRIHLVEGIDILAESSTYRYAIEVKTTYKDDKIEIGEKDFKGLESYHGYIPILCVLKIDLFSEWLFIDPNRLKGKKLSWKINELYTDEEFKKLSQEVNEKFEELTINYGIHIKREGLIYLFSILEKEGIRYK